MRIVFCGDVFPVAREMLRERLPATDEIDVWRNPRDLRAPGRADVLIPMMTRIDAAVMDAVQPRLIHQWGSGLDGVDRDAAAQRGIAIANVPAAGGNADSVAEHCVLLTLGLLRRLPTAQSSIAGRVLGAPIGRILAGSTVCLYGLGSIALALAKRLRPFDVTLIGVTREPAAAKVATFSLDRCYSHAERFAAFASTDVLIICLRLDTETRGIVDDRVFAALRPGACLVNAARGPLVDYEALCRALETGRLSGAALDVFWEEPIAPTDRLLTLPNVIATPHIAGVTDRSYAEIAPIVVRNIERLRRGELNPVV